jgi:hypothetical protein
MRDGEKRDVMVVAVARSAAVTTSNIRGQVGLRYET